MSDPMELPNKTYVPSLPAPAATRPACICGHEYWRHWGGRWCQCGCLDFAVMPDADDEPGAYPRLSRIPEIAPEKA